MHVQITTEEREAKESRLWQREMGHDKVIELTTGRVDGTHHVYVHAVQQYDCHVPQQAFICTLHNGTGIKIQPVTNRIQVLAMIPFRSSQPVDTYKTIKKKTTTEKCRYCQV